VLHEGDKLNLIMQPSDHCTLPKSRMPQCLNHLYQAINQRQDYMLGHRKRDVCEGFDGTVTLLYKGRRPNHSWSRVSHRHVLMTRKSTGPWVNPKSDRNGAIYGNLRQIALGSEPAISTPNQTRPFHLGEQREALALWVDAC